MHDVSGEEVAQKAYRVRWWIIAGGLIMFVIGAILIAIARQ